MSATTPPSLHAFDEPKMEALVELMFLAASADGEFSEQERQHFASSVESLTDRRISGESFERLIARIESDLREVGRARRLAAVRERLASPALRKVALALAIQVTAADGIIRTSERELLQEVAEALEIDPDDAADLVSKLSP
jgi:tellurite resistance protein